MKPFDYRQTATQLDFTALSPEGRLDRVKVRLGVITGFGITHEPVFTPHGTFTRWVSWGYLLTQQRRYRVSIRLVRAWQRAWRWELLRKDCITGLRQDGSGTAHRVVNWEYGVLATTRRGGRWPRRHRASTAQVTEHVLLRQEKKGNSE